jgi:Zn-dependent M28 family amino/carboxypeptidase
MPRPAFRGIAESTTKPLKTRPLRDRLEVDVRFLAESIGERNLTKLASLNRAADFIEDRFTSLGYQVARQTYDVQGVDCHNIEAELPGGSAADEIVIVGAHYDSVRGSPGANDNGSGTAAMLALAEEFAKHRPARTLRFVAFANEEPPYFQTSSMGSWVYAQRCSARRENVIGVIALETMGYFTDDPNTQHYPAVFNIFYPSTGNFIGFVSNVRSGPLLRQALETFRTHSQFPSEGATLPGSITGVGWSDHWSFWQEGYSGLMVTDTAPFRYPHYHLATDTWDKLDYERFAQVVTGLIPVVDDLVSDGAD